MTTHRLTPFAVLLGCFFAATSALAEGGAAADSAPPPPPPPPPPPALVAPPGVSPAYARAAGYAPLHIESTRASSVTLFAPGSASARGDELEGGRAPVARCVSPCELFVQPGSYELRNEAVNRSTHELTVHVGPEGASVRIEAPSRGAFAGGVVLTSLGGASVLLGGAWSALALLSAPGDSYNGTLAAITLAVGALVALPMIIPGAVLIARNLPGATVRPLSPSARGATGAEARWMLAPGLSSAGPTANFILRF